MTYAVLDIETTLDHKHIHGAGVYVPDTGTKTWCDSPTLLAATLSGVTHIVGHNLQHFDLPVLRDVWGWTWDGEVVDTLVIARLVNPAKGQNSLKAIAERAGGELKDDFDKADFDGPVTQKMIDYCLQDCIANWDAYQFLLKEYDQYGFKGECLELEHYISKALRAQEEYGFMFDYEQGATLYAEQKERMNEIDQILKETFPPIITERWSEKTGKRLKDHVEEFNVASRQQIARRLESKGAVWTKRTEKGSIVVDESTLADNAHVPEASLVLEYLTLGKRSAMILSWLNSYEEDGRIHGYVNSNGAVTGRMTHARPNLAQIPSGGEYRSCFVVPDGKKLVGVDASGLELRMLAHYMKDDEFTTELLEGDIHTANQHAFGCATRDQAKTLIYALLYGAGDEKLGSVVGKGRNAGRAMRASYEKRWPCYQETIARVTRIAGKGTVPGLDGRRIHVRSEHAALNSLLQSAGAIVMKKAQQIGMDKAKAYGLDFNIVAVVHDEWQIECAEADAQRVAICFRNAIREAGRHFELRCPLEGDYSIGDSWRDTH